MGRGGNSRDAHDGRVRSFAAGRGRMLCSLPGGWTVRASADAVLRLSHVHNVVLPALYRDHM